MIDLIFQALALLAGSLALVLIAAVLASGAEKISKHLH
jgi:hypothetical protein